VSAQPRRPLDVTTVLGVPIAVGVVLLAQVLEGGSAGSLWQPTAALVVFGGTCGAVLVSFSFQAVAGTFTAVREAFRKSRYEIEPTVKRLVEHSMESRRKGIIALEPELDRTPEEFMRSALMLAVDGTNPKTARQILDIENQARRAAAEVPADLLETAAGYTPTLGILGAVLGLIHVMQSLSEPAKLGSGIAVAFVATVYGVGAANLILLPLASKLRNRAREEALYREVIIEGIVALQEGLNPRLIEQKLQGYVPPSRTTKRARRAA
jgi:chemotaxis protein MotA